MKHPFPSSFKPLPQMLHCHSHPPFSPHIFPLTNPLRHPQNLCLSIFPLHKPNNLSALPRSPTAQWLAEGPEDAGPVELPPSSSTIFATNDDPSPLQVATSVLLTGAISVFLFRSLRRRAKRSKELKFRSSGAKSLKEEALDTLKAMRPGSIDAKRPPSPVQAFLGGISAGVIALILYKFTTTIEAALNRQTLSDSFSVRQITITIRTIVNGLCYLATFVFGINSVGLFLYSGQLAINSFMEGSSDEGAQSKISGQSDSQNSTSTDSVELNQKQGDESRDEKQ